MVHTYGISAMMQELFRLKWYVDDYMNLFIKEAEARRAPPGGQNEDHARVWFHSPLESHISRPTWTISISSERQRSIMMPTSDYRWRCLPLIELEGLL